MSEHLNLIVTTTIGVISAGLLALTWRVAVTIKKRLDMIPEMAAAIAIISDTVATHTIANRGLTRALRSYGFALKGIGCNGDVDRGMVHVNETEDALNKRSDSSAREAMSVQEAV